MAQQNSGNGGGGSDKNLVFHAFGSRPEGTVRMCPAGNWEVYKCKKWYLWELTQPNGQDLCRPFRGWIKEVFRRRIKCTG